MTGKPILERISSSGIAPHVHAGPLTADLLSSASKTLNEYVRVGGYEVIRRILREVTCEQVISLLDEAGLRGRAGGGFPTGHKWWIVSQRPESEKYFICNANAGQPGGFKERFLLNASPHRVIEAVLIGAYALGAKTAFIFLPYHFSSEARLLEDALREAREHGFVGRNAFGSGLDVNVVVYRSLGGYITGEETALLELIEGRVARPRGKPPLPTARGLFDAPTVINNLETVLNAYYILKVGVEQYRRVGLPYAPGTLIFSLSGHVNRPGLYELPLGTPLRQLIFEHGQGLVGGRAVKAVFPGGISSAVLGSDSLDLSLDFDSLRDAASALGSGAVIVMAEGTCMVQVARRLAEFFHHSSCGKCQPCKDGTHRTLVMLNRLDRLDEKSTDVAHRTLPPSRRKLGLNVLNNPGGISYTDTVRGLDKIGHLCEFYKYRGDCHHSTEAANVIQSVLSRFAHEFEHHRINAQCDHERRGAYEPIGT